MNTVCAEADMVVDSYSMMDQESVASDSMDSVIYGPVDSVYDFEDFVQHNSADLRHGHVPWHPLDFVRCDLADFVIYVLVDFVTKSPGNSASNGVVMTCHLESSQLYILVSCLVPLVILGSHLSDFESCALEILLSPVELGSLDFVSNAEQDFVEHSLVDSETGSNAAQDLVAHVSERHDFENVATSFPEDCVMGDSVSSGDFVNDAE